MKGFGYPKRSALSALALVLAGVVNEDGHVFCLLLVDRIAVDVNLTTSLLFMVLLSSAFRSGSFSCCHVTLTVFTFWDVGIIAFARLYGMGLPYFLCILCSLGFQSQRMTRHYCHPSGHLE